jgi:tetratricopeptide (TPR) repeat protein
LKLKEKGDLHESIMAFEAEVTNNPKNEVAWRYLGNTHAECDDDNLAIGALIKASELDPENLDVLLDLSCSFTNNLSRFGALNNLKKWLQVHPLYGSINFNDEKEISLKDLEKEVLDLFVQATEKDSSDPSLHTALGVLYHLTDDYESSENSFKNALELNPDSFSLW